MLAVQHDPFAATTLTARLPLTEAQREVWLTCEMEPDVSIAYNECNHLTLRGPLDVAVLLEGLQLLVDRHESLRAVFSPDGQWMMVRENLQLEVPVIDCAADPARIIAEHEQALLNKRFDLVNGPLLQFVLLRESDTVHHLLRAAHHIVVDGWSSWLISFELGQFYSARVEGREPELAPPPRYGDYAQVEREFVGSDEGQAHLDYWLKLLHNPPPAVDMPHDLPRPRERSYSASGFDMALDPHLVGRLRKLGASQGASLVATTLAAFTATLHRQTGTTDLIVALAAAGQSFHQYNGLIGHAVNLLPLRFSPQPEQRFSELLAQTRLGVLDAFDHQGASFGTIVPELKFERDASRPPLVAIMFNIDVRSGDVKFSGLSTSYRSLERHAEVFELFVNMVDDGKSLLLECSYNSNLFSEAGIRARMAEYAQVLAAICDTPEATLAELPLLTAEARAEISRFNATDATNAYSSVHSQIAEHAARMPDAVALRFGSNTQTYAELEYRANTIAAGLASQGAGPGRFVAVCIERQLDLAAALLGVLKTGAAYLPLDPEFPSERLAYMLEDASALLVLTDAASAPKLAASTTPLVPLETLTGRADFAALPAAASSAAYVIYTSGSTGKPKGVVVPHGALSNFLASMAETPGLQAGDVLAAVTTISFDIAGLELWLPLTVGATVALFDRNTAMDGEVLKAALETQQVTVMQATPATWRLLLASGWSGDAKRFRAYSGGEPMPRELAAQLLPCVAELWNLYGPTETTIWSTAYRINDADQPILIGAPIANTQCHVLDEHLAELPPGITGTLWIGGAGLATGYHARPELTAERFVEHPTLGRLYNTGDLARFTPQGLECLGRIDFQVKLRGYRIELGEIEYALSLHPAVAESAVLVRERSAGDERLVAYVVMKPDAAATNSELRNTARGFLPAYMLPQEFVTLDALPRLPNGKLDRKALPSPFATHNVPLAKTPPRTATEKTIAAIWSEILGIGSIGGISIDDRFLDLGGHSMLAVQAAGRLQKAFGIRLPLRNVMTDALSALAQAYGDVPPTSASAPTAARIVGAERASTPSSAANLSVPKKDMPKKQGFLRDLFGG